MKDWSDLEEKYQEMREKNPAEAEDFKKKMTERFQKTVQALEEESQAEKRQLQVTHPTIDLTKCGLYFDLSFPYQRPCINNA